jgi:hypothetical protein
VTVFHGLVHQDVFAEKSVLREEMTSTESPALSADLLADVP